MKKWKTLDTKTILDSPHMRVIKERVEDFSGKERDFFMLGGHHGSVMVVPVKPDENGNLTYVMVEQYRHPIGGFQMEFPAGGREREETSEVAARRELREETGYEAKHLKFMYSMFVDGARSPSQMAVFLAVVEGEPDKQKLDGSEEASNLTVKEINAAELHKLVLDNELVSSPTLAALLTIVMQGKGFTKYLEEIF